MDWTAVFAEDGNEDFIVISRLMQNRSTDSRLARAATRLHHRYDRGEVDCTDGGEEGAGLTAEGHRLWDLPDRRDRGGYSLREVYYLSINYILGVGCLGIPYAFSRAGFLLCGAILLIVTVFSFMTVMWVAETGIRFEEQRQQKGRGRPDERSSLLADPKEVETDTEMDRYEVIDLVEFYLGRYQKYLYQATLMALMYIGLLAYSQVFCGALSALLWSGDEGGAVARSGVPQLAFGLLVVPLSCVELHEQLSIQALMAAVRFVALFAIILGSVAGLFLDPSRSDRDRPPFLAPGDGDDMSYTARFSGFGVAFSACLFSQLFQHSVPGLLRPLRERPETLPAVPRTMCATLATTSGIYLLLGISAASCFGAATRSSINLNFSEFSYGPGPGDAPPASSVLRRIVAGAMVAFPALDTVSVFPLIAGTLGNNLYSAAGGGAIRRVALGLARARALLAAAPPAACGPPGADERRRSLEEASRLCLAFWRLAAAAPPLVASLFAPDLSFSLLLAGAAGVHVAFLVPSLLQRHSQRAARKESHAAGKTVYTGWYSSLFWCYPVMAFAYFSLCVVSVQIREAIVQGL